MPVARREIAKLVTSDWEASPQSERLEVLRLLCKRLPDLVKQELNMRALEKQRDDLKRARQGASAACTRLVETFKVSGVADKSESGYREFIGSACTLGNYSTKELAADFFFAQDRLETEEQAHRIRSIADKIRLELSSADAPAWMLSFFSSERCSHWAEI